MAKIEWTEPRIKAFEEARAKGMNHYILKQGILKAAPFYFVGMAIFMGIMEDWQTRELLFLLPLLAVCSLLFGYVVTRWVWRKYERSYRDFRSSTPLPHD